MTRPTLAVVRRGKQAIDGTLVSVGLIVADKRVNLAWRRRNADEIEWKRFPLLGAFDLCLKCSHLFNILDARGAISVTERVGVIARIRQLAVGLAKAYLAQQSAPPREEKQQKGGAA